MEKNKLEKILENLYKVNNLLRKPYSGLYVASLGEHYVNYVWVRDCYYQTKPMLKKEPEAYIQTYRSLLDYYKGLNYKYDNKVDHLIKKPFPLDNIRFLHPRFYPNLKEITGDWGNLQIDAIGYFFLGIAEGMKEGLDIIRDDSDVEIINKLINVLVSIKYWTIHDNGIWEENTEIHSSSIGAVLGGLTALEDVGFNMPLKIYNNAKKTLQTLLPNESITKNVDLSLLTLIYPFNIIDETNKELILKNVHELLEKERGVIRYIGDKYYNVNGEAEWTFGFAYLFFSYVDTDFELAEKYLEKLLLLIDENGFVPELYFSNTDKPNDNNPLGWSVAMTILTIEKYIQLKFKN
jgi:phosphorylase kinase alpha/beta subunit